MVVTSEAWLHQRQWLIQDFEWERIKGLNAKTQWGPAAEAIVGVRGKDPEKRGFGAMPSKDEQFLAT